MLQGLNNLKCLLHAHCQHLEAAYSLGVVPLVGSHAQCSRVDDLHPGAPHRFDIVTSTQKPRGAHNIVVSGI